MIFYFSGTGNSEWVARRIAEGTGDNAVSIGDIIKNGNTNISLDNEKTVGVVFPVYAWGVPDPVIKFVKNLNTEKDAYRFAVCTCGDEAGLTLKRLNNIFPFDGGWSIIMPNNYIIMYDIDSPEQTKQKIDNAKLKIPKICEAILSKQKIWDFYKGSFPLIKSYVVNPLFNNYATSTKDFKTESSCTSCGLCERVCPLGNIALKDKKPIWGNNCTQCLACIHHCPVKAIQYGKHTTNKGRYTFGKVTE